MLNNLNIFSLLCSFVLFFYFLVNVNIYVYIWSSTSSCKFELLSLWIFIDPKLVPSAGCFTFCMFCLTLCVTDWTMCTIIQITSYRLALKNFSAPQLFFKHDPSHVEVNGKTPIDHIGLWIKIIDLRVVLLCWYNLHLDKRLRTRHLVAVYDFKSLVKLQHSRFLLMLLTVWNIWNIVE